MLLGTGHLLVASRVSCADRYSPAVSPAHPAALTSRMCCTGADNPPCWEARVRSLPAQPLVSTAHPAATQVHKDWCRLAKHLAWLLGALPVFGATHALCHIHAAAHRPVGHPARADPPPDDPAGSAWLSVFQTGRAAAISSRVITSRRASCAGAPALAQGALIPILGALTVLST